MNLECNVGKAEGDQQKQEDVVRHPCPFQDDQLGGCSFIRGVVDIGVKS